MPEQLAELKKHFPTSRDAASYAMDTFPIVRRRDEEKRVEYSTKRVILEISEVVVLVDLVRRRGRQLVWRNGEICA